VLAIRNFDPDLALQATSHYLYLVLEYCAGGDLKQYIKARGAVPEEQTRAIIMGIGMAASQFSYRFLLSDRFSSLSAAGCAELQRRQIVHRDLKVRARTPLRLW
jgi:serine/threonine protein kinase